MTPGQGDLAAEDLRRADGARAEARLLLDAGAREGATSRLCYAAFHACRAVLTIRGRYTRTHSELQRIGTPAHGSAAVAAEKTTLCSPLLPATPAGRSGHGSAYRWTLSGLITLFQRELGPAPLLGRLFDLRASADYAREPFDVPTGELEGHLAEVDALIARCRSVVAEAVAAGADEQDPPPDH